MTLRAMLLQRTTRDAPAAQLDGFPVADKVRTRQGPARASSRRGVEPVTIATAPYDVYGGPGYDTLSGPTHQAGVMPGHGYEALRTPFGETGVPGAGRERNVSNLDLAANHHPDGYPFAAENGRSTRALPAMPRLVRAVAHKR